MKSKYDLDTFNRLEEAAKFYLGESFKYLNEIFKKDLERLILVEQLKNVELSDEDLKDIEEAGIPTNTIQYLRSDKRLEKFLSVETLNNILNRHKNVNTIISNKKQKLQKTQTIQSIEILGHISNLALFVEVLTNRHLLFLNQTNKIDDFIYNQLSEGNILNIIIFICRNELEKGNIKLDSIKNLFRLRNKAVHHTPKNASEFKVKVEDLFQIWNQTIQLIKLYEDRERFQENKFSSILNFEKNHIQDNWF